MTAPTKAKGAATEAKPKAPANKPAPAKAPEAPANSPKPARTGNSAYAAESVRNQVAEAMAKLTEKGFTRPSISAVTGFSDSQVWRAQNRKVHEAEVPVIMQFIEDVLAGKHEPPARARKPKVEDLQAKIDAAVKALGDKANTPAQYRKIVEAAVELLTA